MQFGTSEETVHDGDVAAFVDAHILFQTDQYSDLVGSAVVILDVANQTHFESFHKDRAGDGNIFHIGKGNVIEVCRLEQVDPFQKIDSDI